MREIAGTLRSWASAGHPFALATVVAVSGSAPRQPGASMAVLADGTVAGSVSGGCVESAVHHQAREVLDSGVPWRGRFGYTADDAFAVGLTCGGEVEVVVHRIEPDDQALLTVLNALDRSEPVAWAIVLSGDRATLGTRIVVHSQQTRQRGRVRSRVAAEASAMLERGRTGLREICVDGTDYAVFVQSWASPPRMIVFGATDFARAICDIGVYLGYWVTVCDARATFTTRARFPAARDVVVEWPHRYLARTQLDARTVVCVLTHDVKFDVPLLAEALERDLGYVGALGSRRTHQDRVRRLREAGVSESALARLQSPIGLDLGARTPEETALSIASEIVARRNGGNGTPLSTMVGPIHRGRTSVEPR